MNPQSLPQDPLAQLRDIHLPPIVSWWPPAPGWWLLSILILATLAITAHWVWRRHQRKAYRRAGVRELQQLISSWRTSNDNGEFLRQLNALLKRVALCSFPSTDVAAMSGARWAEFLDRQCPPKHASHSDYRFSGGPLEFGPYVARLEDVDVETLHRTSLRWLREHRCRHHD